MATNRPPTMRNGSFGSPGTSAKPQISAPAISGAVHRAVEVGLVTDLLAALAGLLVGDLAGVQVGVDRHLLAGHGVEREAGGNLGHAPRAVRYDHELDHDEDQEDHE